MTVRRRTASHLVSAALLQAAETVLERDGSTGVTIRAVAEEAKVSPTSVYNRFDGKDGLIVELATRALAELAAAIDVPDHPDPVARFVRSCRNYRDFALRHPARYALIFGTGSPLGDQSSEVAGHGRDVFAILIRLIEALGPGAAPDQLGETAQSVWSAIHGAVTIEQAGIGQTPNAATSFDNLLDLLVGVVTGP